MPRLLPIPTRWASRSRLFGLVPMVIFTTSRQANAISAIFVDIAFLPDLELGAGSASHKTL